MAVLTHYNLGRVVVIWEQYTWSQEQRLADIDSRQHVVTNGLSLRADKHIRSMATGQIGIQIKIRD